MSNENKQRPQPPDWNTRWVWVTPEEAAEILRKWNLPNRDVKVSNLTKIRNSIRRNGWRSLDPIMFAGAYAASRLLNGQHRLTVLVEQGEPQWVQVCEGVPVDSFDFIDTTSVRGLRDSISIWASEQDMPPIKNIDAVVALIRLRAAYDLRGPRSLLNTSRGMANSEGVSHFAAWPEVVDYAARGRALSGRFGRGAGPSVMGLALYLLEQEFDAEDVRRYEAALKEPVMPEGSALQAVHDAFAEMRERTPVNGSRLVSSHQQVWIILTGWAKWSQSLPSSRLNYNTRGGDVPQLPGLRAWKGDDAA